MNTSFSTCTPATSSSSGPNLPSFSRFQSHMCHNRHIRDYRRRHTLEINAALFDPPPFDPSKLRIIRLPTNRQQDKTANNNNNNSPSTTDPADAIFPSKRRYTLTHNDLTGSLQLSIGPDYNSSQLDGWYTRLLRDEVLAEWSINNNNNNNTRHKGGDHKLPTLNLYCHVSGEEFWPAPPPLRSFIFRREMTLVLDSIAFAERDLLAGSPQLAQALVRVHLVSDNPEFDRIIDWGVFGDRSSWQKSKGTALQEMLSWMMPFAFQSNLTSSESTTLVVETITMREIEEEVEVVDDIDSDNNSNGDGGCGGSNSTSSTATVVTAGTVVNTTGSISRQRRKGGDGDAAVPMMKGKPQSTVSSSATLVASAVPRRKKLDR